MSWFTHSLRAKLLGGFAAVLVILAGIVLYSLSATSGIAEKADTIGTSDLPAVAAIGTINTATSDYRISQFAHVLAKSEQAMAEREEELKTLDRLIRSELTAYEKVIATPEDRRFWEKAARQWDTYAALTPDLVAKSRALRTEEAEAELTGRAREQFDALSSHLVAWSQLNDKISKQSVEAAADTAASARTSLLVLGGLAVALAVAIALLLARGIVSGVSQVLRAAEGIAEGDLDQRVEVKAKDEVGQMAAAFGRLIAYVRDLAGTAEAIAAGDLTADVHPRSERDVLGNAFAKMVRNLREMIGKVSETAVSVGAASQQMATTSGEAGKAVGEIASAVGDVAQGAERQVQMTESARSVAQSLGQGVRQSAEGAREGALAAEQAREVAREGVAAATAAGEAMGGVRESSEQVAAAMQQLAERSQKIGGIVDTITAIAEQTNLLALNAAIEAARAGEQGRGFAVVAEEVRKLAEESQAAAGQISTLIGEIQDETGNAVTIVEAGAGRTAEGVATVEQAHDAFRRINEAVEAMAARVKEIADGGDALASEAERMQVDLSEVAAVAEQSSASTEQVSASTEQTSASTQQIAASAQELASNAESLTELVARFKVAA